MGRLGETRGGCQYSVFENSIEPSPPVTDSSFVVVERLKWKTVNLTFIGPCIANVFSEYNQQDAT